MYDFGTDLEIAKHNLETMEMAKLPVKDPRKIEREKEMGDSLGLSNSIKNTKSVPTDSKEYFIYHPEVDDDT